MLTYRQLLQKCNKDVLRTILNDRTLADLFYKKLPADELVAQAAASANGYMRVVDAMINKEGNWPTHAIILELVKDEMFDDKTFKPTGEFTYYISTNYYNSIAEKVPMNQPDDYFNDKKYHKYMGLAFHLGLIL